MSESCKLRLTVTCGINQVLSSKLSLYYERTLNFRTQMDDKFKIIIVNSALMYTSYNSNKDKRIVWFIYQNLVLIHNWKSAYKKEFFMSETSYPLQPSRYLYSQKIKKVWQYSSTSNTERSNNPDMEAKFGLAFSMWMGKVVFIQLNFHWLSF